MAGVGTDQLSPLSTRQSQQPGALTPKLALMQARVVDEQMCVCANCGTTAAALAELKMPSPHLETAAAVRLAAVVAKAACASDEPPGARAEII